MYESRRVALYEKDRQIDGKLRLQLNLAKRKISRNGFCAEGQVLELYNIITPNFNY